MNKREGFTLVEIVVVLAVIAILAAIAIPVALRLFQVTAEEGTREEMDNLKKALIGDPQKLQSSVRSDFGFLGDMGCLPTAAFGGPALERLLTQGTYPAWAFDATRQTGAGWKGPYITGAATGEETQVFTNDQWGNSYTYTPAAGACPLTATLFSNGPDGATPSPDDITLSLGATETTVTVSGFIKDPNGNPVGSSLLNINYPVNGTLTTASGTTNPSGFYSVSGIPFGKRSLTFPAGSPKLIARSAIAAQGTGAAFCGSGGASPCSYIEFALTNFSTSAVSITSFFVTFTFGPPTLYYYKVVWGTTTLEDCNAAACANTSTTVIGPFAAQTIAAASSALKPFTFFADSAQTQLNDIKIGAAGEIGSTVRVQLINWRDCQGTRTCGTSIPFGTLTGITFTATLSDGSVVQFTPK